MSVGGEAGPESATANVGTGGYHVQHRLDVSLIRREGPEPATANSEIHESHTQASTTPNVTQSNAFFQNAHHVNITGNPSFQNQNIGSVTNVYGGRADGLEKLERFVSFDAQCDSSAQDPDRQCHPGTRQNVLKRLRDWFDNPNSTERIFWLYGPAGAGKSAIAQTIARSYARLKVAATFFFFRSDINRNDGNRLITTLAYQLALSIPEIRDLIVHSIYERPDLPRTDIETQFNQLIARPFQVLSDNATQQLGRADIVDIINKYRQLAPVIVIDGVDECTDDNIQRRFLKLIGDAVKDDRFPLRFFIVSRPELHIEQTIRRFQTSILTTDLAELDDANRDIEKYLVDEFSRIASEQGLRPTWPGQKIINDIVFKSSGNFIFASLVIKFVGDPDNIAETQLEIVLNIKPPMMMTPFAVLDQLFLEILKQVPDQDFLNRFLALLVARISVSNDYWELYEDDVVLMHVSEKELHAKLRRMRSLLVFQSPIDVHHKSFLDFLHDSSRSGQYYTGKQGGMRRYLEVFIDSFVRYVSTMIEQPDHHNTPHFAPRFRAMIKDFPPKLDLPVNEWQELIQPLLDLQDDFLQLSNFTSTWRLLRCDECTVSHLLRELQFLGLYIGRLQGQPNDASVQSVMDVRKRRGVVSSTTTKTEKKGGNDLDSLLLSLFAQLPEIVENWSPTEDVIELMNAILSFDYAETAMRVRFVSDAQKLIDLLADLIDEKLVLSRIPQEATRKATLLGLAIFARVPILPLSAFLNGNNQLLPDPLLYRTMPIQMLSQTIFASRILDRHYTAPLLVVKEGNNVVKLASGDADENSLLMMQRGRTSTPSSVTAIQIMFGLAKAIQYFHSLGVVLYREFSSRDVFLDSNLRPRIRCMCSTSLFLLDKPWKERLLLEDNIFCFGCLFYEIFSGVDTKPSVPREMRRCIVTKRPSVPEIPEYAWQLIQRCCDKYPKSRPIIDEVVQEMENWKIM